MKLLSRLVKPLQPLFTLAIFFISLVIFSPLSMATIEQKPHFSQAQLDQMLAPVALYPDTILSQVLIASTYPIEIVQADRWVRSNSDLKTEDALKFAENKDWDPSVKALVAFPEILKRMSNDIDWTQRLGDAFLTNEADVMDAVQRLRKRAYATGNLEKAKHIRVEQEDKIIVIEPREERVVYVPVYDTRVVYGNWWWPDYPPVYWHYPSSYTYVSGFYWGPSIYIGPTYFRSSCHWRDRRVVVVDHYNNYSPSTVINVNFYTSRSIVHYQGSRSWYHDPVHRRGVAYYTENLRTTYGSPRESYARDRVYRDQYLERSRTDNPHDSARIIRPSDSRPDSARIIRPQESNRRETYSDQTRVISPNPTTGHYDRAEQLRERMSRVANPAGERINLRTDSVGSREASQDTGMRSPNTQVIQRSEHHEARATPNQGINTGNLGERSHFTDSRTGRTVERTEQNDRRESPARLIQPSPRAIEQQRTAAPRIERIEQPRIERREEAPRRVEIAPRQESRSEERAEPRNEQQAERQSNSARMVRDSRREDIK